MDEPLAFCMIVHISAHISKWELVCKFGVIFHIFIIFCLGSRFHAWNWLIFHSIITFSYTKYLVHSYTVDVVFTLSYEQMSDSVSCSDWISKIIGTCIISVEGWHYILSSYKLNRHWEANLVTYFLAFLKSITHMEFSNLAHEALSLRRNVWAPFCYRDENHVWEHINYFEFKNAKGIYHMYYELFDCIRVLISACI